MTPGGVGDNSTDSDEEDASQDSDTAFFIQGYSDTNLKYRCVYFGCKGF